MCHDTGFHAGLEHSPAGVCGLAADAEGIFWIPEVSPPEVCSIVM
jgi:hypothetical protein